MGGIAIPASGGGNNIVIKTFNCSIPAYGADATTVVDLSAYKVKSNGSNLVVGLRSVSGTVSSTGSGVSLRYVSHSYNSSTKKLSVVFHNDSMWLGNETGTGFVAIIGG